MILCYGSCPISSCPTYYLLDKYFEMKVYTSVSEDVITEFIPTSTPKLKFYNDNGIQVVLFEEIASKLKVLKEQVCTFKDISVFFKYTLKHL